MKAEAKSQVGGRIPPAGMVGRVGKAVAGLFQLLFVYLVLTHFAGILRKPPTSGAFWIMAAGAAWLTPEVVNIGLLREHALGRRPLMWVVAVFLLVGASGWVIWSRPWSPVAAVFVAGLAVVVHGYMGASHLASALIGFPGCELRALAWAVGRARGDTTTFTPCPGLWTPLDRWEARLRGRN